MSPKPNRKAQLLTGLLIAAIAAFLVARQQGVAPEPAGEAATSAVSSPPGLGTAPSPQDAIYAMLDAARAGDVGTYRSFFTGQLAASLDQSIAENGEAKFGEYLKRTNATVKGVAINEPERPNESQAKARVEYVYADRNEAQNMFLVKLGEAWKIERLEEARALKPLVPYGTPVK